jgi:hypothetical protein
MDIQFTSREEEVIDGLAEKLNLSRVAVIRRALRVYQLVAENEEVLRSLVPNDSPGCGVIE